jgi:hypothetical protein
MLKTTGLVLGFLIAGFQALDARIVRPWTYQELFEKANLVVIGEVVGSEDNGERTELVDVEPHVPVIGLITKFKSLLVIKGSKDLATFGLHHYKFSSDNAKLAGEAPDLVEVAGQHQVYLLFLIAEHGGLYVPVSGQTDPASFSVLELKGGAN